MKWYEMSKLGKLGHEFTRVEQWEFLVAVRYATHVVITSLITNADADSCDFIRFKRG